MLSESKIEVVPINEVPPPKPDHAVNGLEAWFVDDGKISDGTLRGVDIAFEVRGLPHGQQAWIMQSKNRCQLVREVSDGEWEWMGEFLSVRDALQALSKQLS